MARDLKTLRMSPHGRRFDLCGDHMAAIVLDQLAFWWRKGTRLVYGVEWRAKPREQLAAELRMSAWQIRKALELLKDKGLIETSQHLFGGYGERLNVMHYRLLPAAIELFEAPVASPSGAETTHPEMAENHQLLDHTPQITNSGSYISSNEDIPEPSASGLAPATSLGYGEGEIFEGKSYKEKAKTVLTSSPKTKNLSPKGPLPAAAGAKPRLTAAEMIAGKKLTGSFPGNYPTSSELAAS